ncbi:GlxA family transcriptional regulator [Paracoccus luteus]|uniref:GlxA family transcriptional regulator n=1 Tax=Paracoccus luteus TaxID=2508543 RepID=UPI00106F5298|nr:GlxA family transcriptional regulator [Paracoccus luteus]
MNSDQKDFRIALILQDKFTLAAFSGFMDVLRLAADDAAKSRQNRISWEVYGLGSSAVRSSCGVSVTAREGAPSPPDYDYLAICGGNSYEDDAPATALMQMIQAAHRAKKGLLGICTGSFAIARAGLVGQRTFCIHWNVLDAFRSRFPKALTSVDRIFIDDGDVITCAGSTAAIDLGLYLVVRHCGKPRAQQVMRHMMLTEMRPASVPQAHFYLLPEGDCDNRLRRALHFMEQQLDHPPSIAAIARYCGVSVRQLERIFREALNETPVAAYRRMRLNYGRHLLTASLYSITEIAHTSGFSDAAHFSREFRKRFGIPPQQYRRSIEARQ